MNVDSKIVEWVNKCPLCYSQIVWSMPNGSKGSTCYARCSKSLFASVNVKSISEIKICEWEGSGVRQADGGVRFKNENGSWLREMHFVKNRKNIR